MINQVSYKGTDQTVKKPRERERPRRHGATPAEFPEESNKEDRKGVDHRVGEGQRDEADANHDPSEGDGGLMLRPAHG